MYVYPYTDTAGRTYRVMLDDHAVQQGANSIETTHVQTCEFGNTVKQSLNTTNHWTNISQGTFLNVNKEELK